MGNLFKKWSEEGLRLPFVHDPVTKQPSVTLLFPYVTFFLSVASIAALHVWPEVWPATSAMILMWTLATVFYMLRKLSKAKFNLEEKSLELDSEDTPETQLTPKSDDSVGN